MGDSPRKRLDSPAIRLDRQDPYLRLQSVSIYVRDLDRSVNFYVDQLGFQLVLDTRHQPGGRWVAVAPPDGSANLTLISPEPGSAQCKLIGRPTHVSFMTEDVLAKFREWTSRGVCFQLAPRLRRLKYNVRLPEAHADDSSSGEEPAPIWGGVFARFRDPDGNSFSLVSFDEMTRAIEEQRRAAAEHLESERRAAQELEIAKQVQARLFPQTLPPLRTLDYAGMCLQARHVGGDYFDFLDLGRGRLGMVIGDISGKGIAAALLMANLQANLRSQCAIAVDRLEELLRSVNQLFCQNTAEGAFATLLFAEYDDASRRLRYANCGHLSALLLHANGSVERLEATATVLGLFKLWDCSLGERQLFPSDLLALYTDGITESFNQDGEEFGEERLIGSVRRHQELASPSLLAAVIEEVRSFSPHEQHDDVTLIVAKCLSA